jgi:hypothetical protein
MKIGNDKTQMAKSFVYYFSLHYLYRKIANMTQEEAQEILKTYRWIQVKSYKMDETASWEQRYQQLEKHHIEETTFLIEKIREIVQSVYNTD